MRRQQKHSLVQMYNFTISLQPRNTYCQELSSPRTCVFFRRGWHRWWWLYANHCPFQITLLSQLLTEPAFPSGHSLAAAWRHRGWWRLVALVELISAVSRDWEQFPVFLQIPPATLNCVFSSLRPSWGKLSSRASGQRRLMRLRPPPNLGCLVSSLRSLGDISSNRLVWSVCVIFCLNHIVTMLRVQWKDFIQDIELSQILINLLLRLFVWYSHGIIWLCWLCVRGQAHCHWGPGLSALSCSPDPLESVLFWDKGLVFSPVRLGSGGIRPSFIRFFCFILRFWNQIFTWKITFGYPRVPCTSMFFSLVSQSQWEEGCWSCYWSGQIIWKYLPESHWAEAPLQSLSVSPASDIY